MENRIISNKGLVEVLGEVGLRLIAPWNSFDLNTRPRLWRKSLSSNLKCRLDQASLGLQREIKLHGNCAGCNKGFATIPVEISVRSTAL